MEDIRPNPQQPRQNFSQEGLQQLAQSIRQYGILQPLTVRKRPGGYELVAGERRWRAAALAGWREVPCLIARIEDQDSGLLALIENLHRRDLNCFEEARAIAALMERYDLNQSEVADKLGKSQSAVANKLRLLRLRPDIRQLVLEHDLTERHARALLRLTDEELQRQALEEMVKQSMNVAQAEALTEKLLHQLQTQPPRCRPTYIIKDVRLFLNSIRHQVELMNHAGAAVNLDRQDTPEAILLTIKISRETRSK